MGLFKKPGFGFLTGSGGAHSVRNARLERMEAGRAADVCARFELQEPARELLTPEIGPADFFRLLVKHRHHRDAVAFLAYGLPLQEAVWWGCRCVRADAILMESPGATKALEAAERWVADPTASNRETARLASKESGYEMPQAVAAWLAAAAAASEGSLCEPVGKEPPPTDEGLAAHCVSGAVLLAASNDEKSFKRRIADILELGVQVADGPEEAEFLATRSL